MTRRDEFAKAALTWLLANSMLDLSAMAGITKTVVRIADATIAELDRTAPAPVADATRTEASNEASGSAAGAGLCNHDLHDGRNTLRRITIGTIGDGHYCHVCSGVWAIYFPGKAGA